MTAENSRTNRISRIAQLSRILLVACACTAATADVAAFVVQAQAPVTTTPAPAVQADDQSTAKSADSARPPVADKPASEALTPKQKELAEDTAKLLQLANELKADMDKSSKEMLSLAVVKKADQIERLARKVREEMRVNLGITPGN